MDTITQEEIVQYVEGAIQRFHASRLRALAETEFNDLLQKKNPYLFRAKNLLTAQELVLSFLDAKLSSSEEKMFGDFLEGLAIFVASKTLHAMKSASHGIDFEYQKEDTRYLVTVKSGANWGNSSQWGKLEADFQTAVKILKQSHHVKNVECILGIAYGKAKSSIRRGLINVVHGQTFWYILSGQRSFYQDIVEPVGHRAKEHNESFAEKKAELVNKFTRQFIEAFCDSSGKILWEKLVCFNSGNLTAPEERRWG